MWRQFVFAARWQRLRTVPGSAKSQRNGTGTLPNELLRFSFMNILFFADNFPPERNAQASRVFERACHWAKWSHNVSVITCAPNFPEGRVVPGYKNKWYQTETLSGIRVVRVKTFIAANKGTLLRSVDYVSYMLPAFIGGLFQTRPDIVAATSPLLFAAVAGCLLAIIRRVPFVMEVSDLWPDSIVAVGAMKRNPLLRMLERLELWLYRQAKEIVVLTPAFKQNLVDRGVPAAKIAVVTNGVELSRFQPRARDAGLAAQWGIKPGDFVVSYIGTLGMAHGLNNALICAKQLAQQSRAKFLFVGPGAEREQLVSETLRAGLTNVVFVPAQPKEGIPDFWALSNAALVHLKDAPLFRTVIPSKIFEAMAMGLPIILVAPEGEASRIVLEKKAGVWVRAGDPAALAEAVMRLENDCVLASRYAAASLAAAPGHSRERQAREMMSSFINAIEGPEEVRTFAVDY